MGHEIIKIDLSLKTCQDIITPAAPVIQHVEFTMGTNTVDIWASLITPIGLVMDTAKVSMDIETGPDGTSTFFYELGSSNFAIDGSTLHMWLNDIYGVRVVTTKVAYKGVGTLYGPYSQLWPPLT